MYFTESLSPPHTKVTVDWDKFIPVKDCLVPFEKLKKSNEPYAKEIHTMYVLIRFEP